MSKEQSKFSSFMTAKKEIVEQGKQGPGEGTKQSRNRKPKTKETPVLLHIPDDLLGRIDAIVDSQPLKISRRAWIMQRLFQAVTDTDKNIFKK
jgi:hypothetical protein